MRKTLILLLVCSSFGGALRAARAGSEAPAASARLRIENSTMDIVVEGGPSALMLCEARVAHTTSRMPTAEVTRACALLPLDVLAVAGSEFWYIESCPAAFVVLGDELSSDPLPPTPDKSANLELEIKTITRTSQPEADCVKVRDHYNAGFVAAVAKTQQKLVAQLKRWVKSEKKRLAPIQLRQLQQLQKRTTLVEFKMECHKTP